MSRRGRVWEGTNHQRSSPGGGPPKGGIAQTSGGHTHIVDVTDPAKPRKVGRDQLEDTDHDIIVEDDILYQANAPFVMNAMPWKGHVLFTDFNSGLWAAKLEPVR
jgi:hypothetical protein